MAIPTAKVESGLTAEGLPGPEGVASDCPPRIELKTALDIENSASSETAPTPKGCTLTSSSIIVGKRRCSFSASEVNEIKIYHAEHHPPSAAEVAPCEVLHVSSVPGGMETTGDASQIANSAQIPSVPIGKPVPKAPCKSSETHNCESEVILSEQKDRTPVARHVCPSFEAQPGEGSSRPKENGSHTPPLGGYQANFQNDAQILTRSKKPFLFVIEADAKEKSSASGTLNDVKTLSESDKKNIADSSVTSKACSDSQTGLHPSITNTEEEPGTISNVVIAADEMKKQLDCDSAGMKNHLNPALPENVAVTVSDFTAFAQPDPTSSEAKEEMSAVSSEFVPAVQNKRSPKQPVDSAADPLSDTKKFPCVTRRKHRLLMVSTACEGSSENSVTSVSEPNLSESVNQVPNVIEGLDLLSSGSPDARGLYPKVVAEQTLSDAPSCLEQELSKQVSDRQNHKAVETVLDTVAVVLPNHNLRLRRQACRITGLQGMSRSCALNQTSSNNHPAKSEQIRNGNQCMPVYEVKTNAELPVPTSLEHPAAPQSSDNSIEGLTKHEAGSECDFIKHEAKVTVDSESKVVSSTKQVQNQKPSQQFLGRDNSKAFDSLSVGEAPVSSAFNGRVRTRRLTTVHPKKKPKIPEEGQTLGSVLHTSLSSTDVPRAYENGIVERVVDHTASATSDFMKEGSKSAHDSEGNLRRHPKKLLHRAVKASADETVPVMYTSRGRKVINRLTAIIIGKPVSKENDKIPEGCPSSNDPQCISVPQNGLEKDLAGEILEHHVALQACNSNIPERIEPTTDTKPVSKENPKDTFHSESSKQPSKVFPQQENCEADEPTSASLMVPPVFSRRGRKTRRLTTFPEVSSSKQNSEDPSAPLHNLTTVAECSRVAHPSLMTETAPEIPPVLETGEVVPDPLPSGQDKEYPGPIPQALNPIGTADALPVPKRRRRVTGRLTTGHEVSHEITEETILNETLVDIANKSCRRSVRKRRLPPSVENVCPHENENISPSSQVALPGNSDLDSVSSKKRKISFNEVVKCWNPILQEMTWRGLTDEIREVPLLKPVPKSKKAKQTTGRKRKARKSSQAVIEEGSAPEESQLVEIVGICVPTSLKAPNDLRPVLKPSPVPVAPPVNAGEKLETETPKRKYAKRKLVLKNMKQLVEKYGSDFSYKQCLKVDGRFHCPDEDCMDNDHRGYNNEKVLRNHIKINHIDVDCPTCEECGKSFATNSRLNEHKIIHSDVLPYPCTDCDKSFKTAALLKQHAGFHGGFGKCFYCSKIFNSKRLLANHFRDTPCRCDCCKVTLWCPTNFMQHERQINHHYRCRLCSQSYETRATFIRHIRDVHYDKTTALDGRYQCKSCERKFTNLKNCHRHIRRNHTVDEFVEPSVSLVT